MRRPLTQEVLTCSCRLLLQIAADMRDGRRKTKALARDGLNEVSTIVRVAKGLPQRPDVLGEIRFFNETVRPQRLHQVFLFNQVTGALDEKHQRVESFGRQGDQLPITQESSFFRLELK